MFGCRRRLVKQPTASPSSSGTGRTPCSTAMPSRPEHAQLANPDPCRQRQEHVREMQSEIPSLPAIAYSAITTWKGLFRALDENDSFRPDSGPSRGDPCRRASRPFGTIDIFAPRWTVSIRSARSGWALRTGGKRRRALRGYETLEVAGPLS
jgi:hypothetical protein